MNRNELQKHGAAQSTTDILSPENLAKVIQAKRVSLEVGAGLNYVRPRAKPYYCYRRFKKRMGQRKEGEGLSEEGESFSGGEGSSGQLSLAMQSESGELPSMLNPQEREQSERRRSSRSQPQPIWTPEVHLYLWERARVYIESYRRNVTVTIHPAILDEENIKQLLYNEDSNRDCTPLSLNIFLAISLGAHAEGEKQTWLEFWMKSRNELSSLFDETDYNVAVALFLMGCHTFFANNEREKAMYYVLLSQTICRRMGYLNSDPYLRGLAFLTFQARKKPLTVKALRKFQERMVEMNAQPYYYIPLHGNPKLEKLTNDIVERAPTGHPTEYLDYQDFMFQSLHNTMAKILFNVATGFALTKLKMQQRYQKEQQIQQYLNNNDNNNNNNNNNQSESESRGKDHNTEERKQQTDHNTINDDFNQAFTEELIQKLLELNNELEQRGSSYKGPYLVWVKSFSASLIVDVLWNLGDTKRALEMSMVYLRMAETQPFQRTISSVPVLCLPILNVFLATQNFSLLEELLRSLAPLKTRFQPLEALLAPFEERLEIHSQEQNMYELLNMKDEDGLLSLFPSPTSTAGTSPTSSLSHPSSSSIATQHLQQRLQQQLQQQQQQQQQQQLALSSAHSNLSLIEDSQELGSSAGSQKGSFPF